MSGPSSRDLARVIRKLNEAGFRITFDGPTWEGYRLDLTVSTRAATRRDALRAIALMVLEGSQGAGVLLRPKSPGKPDPRPPGKARRPS